MNAPMNAASAREQLAQSPNLTIDELLRRARDFGEKADDGFYSVTRSLNALSCTLGSLDDLGGITARDMEALLGVINCRLEGAIKEYEAMRDAVRLDLPALLTAKPAASANTLTGRQRTKPSIGTEAEPSDPT